MKLPLTSSLYLLLLGFSLVLILKYYEAKAWLEDNQKNLMKRFSEKSSRKNFLKSLENSRQPLKKVEVTSPMPMHNPATKFENMTKIDKWQHFLRRRFQETENLYYPIIDDLTQKISDLELHTREDFPEFDIHQFTFVKEWQAGDKSSEEVWFILKTMNMNTVAETQLTRRLENYIHKMNNHMVIEQYVKPCIELIKKNAVPKYASYLDMLTRYFGKLVEIDHSQEKITWIERVTNEDKTIKQRIHDMNINQVVRQLDHQVIPFNSTRYTVGKNLICLDEDMARGAYAMHWLFAPQSYIEALKKEFKITDVMDIEQEAEYIKRLIGAYVK